MRDKDKITHSRAASDDALPDWTFIASDDGTLVETVSGAAVAERFCAGLEVGSDITSGLPRDVAELVKVNFGKALRSRADVSFEFRLEDQDRRGHFELRLIVVGRKKVMGILRDLQRFPAAAAPVKPSDVSASAPIPVAVAVLDAAVSDARLRERGIAVMVVGLEQLVTLTKRIGKPVRRAMFSIAAKRMEDCLRSPQRNNVTGSEDLGFTNLARLGSEEFLIVLSDVEQREAVGQVADRIRRAFANPLAYEGHEFTIEPAVGIALHPTDGETSDELLKHARVALDEASIRSDQGYEFYSSTMRFRALQRLDRKTELGWAIENDQLGLRYLPRIDLKTGHVGGLEALLRWEHPLRGTVGLDEVIPLAEATGLMRPLGEWILGSACAQAARWQDDIDGMPPVSINLSESEFTREGLDAVILNALDATGLRPDGLELEISEETLMRAADADVILEKLGNIGVGLVIDDFGVGYSSLGRLTRLPVKAIKINRKFVERCQHDNAERSVCSAIIALAKSLDLTVVAVGVESTEQIDFLREHGCHALQGFLITEPLLPRDVEDFVTPHLGNSSESTVVDLDTIRTRFRLCGAI
ncbi:MAG: GGDEF domain-containing phosphodiesterase [Gammaproteobacteria bacterium]|nr:GGDEF domain-containing phosphodiesterase [Gammaproteobacteria bacterium]NNC58176.1 EAL domain-containing protein [Woeseiaceae bacterium]